MKRFLPLAMTAIFTFAAASFMRCQIINDNINIVYGLQEYGANVYEDPGSTSNAEPTVRLTMEDLDGNAIAEVCEAWNGCFGSDCLHNYNGNVAEDYATGLPYDVLIQFRMEGWENDDVTGCDYNDGDENYMDYLALGQWDNNTITFNRNPCQWYSNWCDDDLGLYVGAPGINYFHAIPAIAYRYSSGNSYTSPLKFGVLSGSQIVMHENSNSQPEGVFYPSSYYSDTEGNSTPDIFYSFTLEEAASVTISTEGSDFDTQLQLFSPSDFPVAFNDDANGGLTSELTEVLCAGEYKLRVEGAGWLPTGQLSLSVEVNSFDPISLNANVTDVSCPGENDGSVVLEITGGVPPYSGYWPDNVTGLEVDGLEEGTYFGYVQDECPGNHDFEVVIQNGDVTPPSFECPSYSFQTEQNGEFVLTMNELLADMMLSDNCGDVVVDYQEMTFDLSEVNEFDFNVEMTDESGNSASCTVEVVVEEMVGLSDLEIDQKFIVYPNPAEEYFFVQALDINLNGFVDLQIRDLSGKLITQERWIASQAEVMKINANDLAPGVYVLQIINDQKVKDVKLVKH